MKQTIARVAVLAAAVGFSTLALAATGAQTSPATPPPSSSQPQSGNWQGMHHGMMRHGMQDGRNHHDRMGMGMRMLGKLDLTDAQRTSIRQMTHQSMQQSRPAMQDLMQKRRALDHATPGTRDYQTAVTQLAQAEAQAAQARVVRDSELRTRIYDTLTPAQRTQLASLRSERAARMKQWRETHGPKSSQPASAASAQ